MHTQILKHWENLPTSVAKQKCDEERGAVAISRLWSWTDEIQADLCLLELVSTSFDGPYGTVWLRTSACSHVGDYLYHPGRNNGMINLNCDSDKLSMWKPGAVVSWVKEKTLETLCTELGESWQRSSLYILLASRVPGSWSCQDKEPLFLNSENTVSIQELRQNLLRAPSKTYVWTRGVWQTPARQNFLI